ncbi:hypothetical protein PINS_up012953 [Pythium insidiosum]|nr:hypothetical protein PINS_up012953 [Pythium insidiosum]
MGRKKRHSARTGDGGAELRLKKRELKDAERAHKAAELEFYDDPSENDAGSDVESEGSDFGDEEEVMQLGEDEDEDDDDDDDEEEDGDDDDDDIGDYDGEEEKKRIAKMDAKWGKSKKNYYSADTAEFEMEDAEEVAKDEENAALDLQRKQAELMDDDDFGFDAADGADDDEEEEEEEQQPVDDEELLGDQLADIAMIADESESASIEQVQKDFSKLTKKDKLQIVNQSAPELLGLSAELENTMKELNEVVKPAILKLRDVRRRTKAYNSGLQYLVTRQNLMLNYVANISFYLLLRAEGKSVKDHPVLQHLLALKKQMNKLQQVDDAVNTQLHDLLTQEFPEDVDDGLDKFFGQQQQKETIKERSSANSAAAASSKKTQPKKKSKGVSEAEMEEAAMFYEAAVREKAALAEAKQQLYTHEKPGLASSDEEDSDLEDGAKRGASFEIIKNKGLKAHKSKLNRNPRVKKRLQYRKAVIRRKGQVRDVRVGEASRYGGESTGIKANLSRSRKIRN